MRIYLSVIAITVFLISAYPGICADINQDTLLIESLRNPVQEGDARSRATIIDQLAKDHVTQAVPALIDCLSDTRGLHGSDNWVGGHAANALHAITGKDFGLNAGKWHEWYETLSQPIFSVRTEFAHSAGVDVPKLKQGQAVGLVVTVINETDREQRLPLCGSGIWITDNRNFDIEPQAICKTLAVGTLAPHSMLPGAVILNLIYIASPGSVFPERVRIGILPPGESTCNAIFPGDGRCGDANSSWSDPISLSP
jgi:hypothetical protein